IQADREHETSWADVEADIFSEPLLLTRPLLEAIRADEPIVRLIDEGDRGESETEALRLAVLPDVQVSIPELGRRAGKQRPLHVLLKYQSDIAKARKELQVDGGPLPARTASARP